jgi:UDP-N-acetylmuramyl pentapeptide phosphotransferase/UDP-N-acetylglucosamine-1-phosphate transferase
MLERWGVVDVPNARSSHGFPTIRGMGLATAISACGTALVLGFVVRENSEIILGLAVLAIVSATTGFVEDIRGISAPMRAVFQLSLGLAFGLYVASWSGMAWYWLPLVVIAIAGYINVANFMDGINGISGLHGGIAGFSYVYLGLVTGREWLVVLGALTAGVFLAFLPWNLGRRVVFLGDVGSYLLGALLSGMAAVGVVSGINIIAAIGPLSVYLADTGLTLARRVLKGERWFEAHRTHVYQRLANGRRSHISVALMVTAFTAAASVSSMIALTGEVVSVVVSAILLLAVLGIYVSLPRILSARDRAQTTGASA